MTFWAIIVTRLTTFKSSSDYLQFTLLVFPLQMMVRVIVMVVRILGRMVTMMVVMKEPIPAHTNPYQPKSKGPEGLI